MNNCASVKFQANFNLGKYRLLPNFITIQEGQKRLQSHNSMAS